MRPFLLRYAKPCSSPGRVPTSANYAYDHEIDMVRKISVPGRTPAIYCQDDDDDGPKTKKFDVEKGEDCKDRRMWQ